MGSSASSLFSFNHYIGNLGVSFSPPTLWTLAAMLSGIDGSYVKTSKNGASKS